MLVEDNLAHQKLMQQAFAAWPTPSQLVIRNSIAEAQAYLSEHQPDLVIADYQLPDGAAMPLLPNGSQRIAPYPVVILAGHIDDHVAVEAMKAGACDYIVKSEATLKELPRIASRALRDWDLVVERRQAEAALHESEERYRLLVESSPDAISVIDHDCRVLFANPATYLLLKVPDDGALIGKSFLDLLDEVDRPAARQRVKEMTELGQTLPPRVYRFTRFDGSEAYGSVTSTPLEYQGKVVIQTITRDITEQKRAAEALQQAHAELENKVAERTRELQAANEKLHELDQLKSMFVASMSHELRTPLNSIIGFTGVILEGMSGEINPRQRDQLSRVYASARHLLSLVSDVIDISKIEAGKIDVDIDEFSLRPLIEESASVVHRLAIDKGLTIKIDMPAVIELRTDRRRLLQVVLNLVSNAVKYTERGGVSISAELAAGKVCIHVSDTGAGIDEAAMQRLFQPFERLNRELRAKVLGTGLGLYLSKKLVEDILQGELGVSSEVGVGSSFWLEVPQNLLIES